jgi:ribulose-5-phosphate 4-epimerase/fuculose-1-phosphate aldolase
VAEAANVLARLGLVTAYGHVSARAGEFMLITPAADLAGVTGSEVLRVPMTAPALPAGVPAEGWAHLALYRARPDAAAIARAQPASAFAVTAVVKSLPVLHGQAAWLGAPVPVHQGAELLRRPDLAERAARAFGAGEALLLRGNGALTLGATPGIAVARMWLLAAACEVYLAAAAATAAMTTAATAAAAATAATASHLTALSPGEIASWRAAGDELLPRLWQHLRRR